MEWVRRCWGVAVSVDVGVKEAGGGAGGMVEAMPQLRQQQHRQHERSVAYHSMAHIR